MSCAGRHGRPLGGLQSRTGEVGSQTSSAVVASPARASPVSGREPFADGWFEQGETVAHVLGVGGSELGVGGQGRLVVFANADGVTQDLAGPAETGVGAGRLVRGTAARGPMVRAAR